MWKRNITLLVLTAALSVIPLLIHTNLPEGEEPFIGADNKAESIIQELNPEYTPWFTSIWAPPSGEIESLLFALQAGLGAGLIGFYLGRVSERQRLERHDAREMATSVSTVVESPRR